MPGPVHNYDGEYVIQNIGDLKNNYDEYGRDGNRGSATTTTVTIANFSYTDATIDVQVGDTITWTVAAGIHTVTSGVYATDGLNGDGLFTSTFLAEGNTYSLVVDRVGNYNYFCKQHPTTPSMVGLIRVSARKSADLTGYVPVSKIVPGPSSLRGRSSAYTPSMGGNPLDMGK